MSATSPKSTLECAPERNPRVPIFRRGANGSLSATPTVSIAMAKRAGANAVVISERIDQQLEQLKGRVVPEDIDVSR